MFSTTENGLTGKPLLFRYFYFLLSSFRIVSYRKWKAKGEPNPFVLKKTARRRHTSQQEIVDIFQKKA